MRCIQAPDLLQVHPDEKTVFMAGGITGCHNWQEELTEMLAICNPRLTLINPRRDTWNMESGEDESRKQIEWEWLGFTKSKACLFWFPPETICPIALFELGKQSARHVDLFVGCHPEYKRRFDVKIQMELERPAIQVVDSLENLAEIVIAWSRSVE